MIVNAVIESELPVSCSDIDLIEQIAALRTRLSYVTTLENTPIPDPYIWAYVTRQW